MAEGRTQQIAIVGSRRIGKTLLLKEFMYRLLKSQCQVVSIFMGFQELAISSGNICIRFYRLDLLLALR